MQGHLGLGITNGYPLAFDQGSVSVSAGSVAEEVLARVRVPGNVLGRNGYLYVNALWAANNTANAKTCRIRFSGAAGVAFLERDMANNVAFSSYTLISNHDNVNTQLGGSIQGGHGLSTTAFPTSAINTLVDTFIVFTGQKAVGADTLTLTHFNVLLTPGN